MTIVQLIGVVQFLFITIALLCLPGNRRRANRWLAALFLCFAAMFSYLVLAQNDLLYLAPLTTFMRLPQFFVYGPLLYLYLYQVAHPWEELPVAKTARHFVPCVVVFLALVPSLSLDYNFLLHTIYYSELKPIFPLIPDLNETQQWLRLVARYVMPLFVLHLFVYVALSLQLLRGHKQRVSQHFSQIDKVSLDWMRTLLFVQLLIWIALAARHWLFAHTSVGSLIDMALQPVLVAYLCALGLYGLLQKTIPLPEPLSPALPANQTEKAAPGKYQHSTLTERQHAEGLRKLKSAMLRDKPYLDCELTVTTLAERLQFSPRHLSQIINSSLNQSFIDFINAYRVEEARALLGDRACSRSILTIAMDVGFNSKSAFYTAFRRHVGQTPSQYREAALKMTAALPSLEGN